MNEHPIILFDGICNFCNGTINFLLKKDKKSVFRYAAFQSEAGMQLLQQHHLPKENFQSFVLIDKGHVYQRSAAVLKILDYLPWYWKGLLVFRVFPAFFRDAVYNLIARNRYKWFGKREQCMIPTPAVRDRFLT